MIRSDLPLHRSWYRPDGNKYTRNRPRKGLCGPGFGRVSETVQIRGFSSWSLSHHQIVSMGYFRGYVRYDDRFSYEITHKGKRSKVRRRNVNRGTKGFRH